LPINTNQALFSLLGTTYGGNGTTNFALPNLTGLAPANLTYMICVNGLFPSMN
jgi:microcystin-dependent protein